jgi:hypothetical protein
LIGWVGYPEALVALVSSDQDDGIQACSGKPNHLAYAMNLLHRRLPGGHQHHHVGCPCPQVISAKGRIKGGEGKQQVSRGAGGHQGRIGLGWHCRGPAGHRTYRRDVLGLRQDQNEVCAVPADIADTGVANL